MKAALLACVLLGLAASAYAQEHELDQSEARFLYFNTSSTATSLTLLGALILLGVIAYLIWVGGVLNTGSSGYGQRNDYQYGYDQQQGYDYQAQYR